MIKTLTRHYRRIPKVGKLLFGIAFFLGVFLFTFKFMYADSIPFENQLTGMFTWLNTGYYSNTYFHFGGNNFVGIIFWSGSTETLSTGQEITINTGAQKISCTGHLVGIYYNNQRGRRIRPLDTGNLAILSGQGSWYDTMTITWWFYTNCTWLSWYIPQSNEVYGQIDHTLGWTQVFHMFAGISYNFTGNAISGAVFDHTLRIDTWWVHTGFMFDTEGGIAELSMNMPWCQDFQSLSGTWWFTVPQWSWGGIVFNCRGQNVSGYRFKIFASGSILTADFLDPYTWSSDTWYLTGWILTTGDYVASCTAMWPTGGPDCAQIPFHVGTWTIPPSWTGCSPNFQWEINFVSYNGSTVINQWLGTYITNKTGIMIQSAATEPVNFIVSGEFLWTLRSNNYLSYSMLNPTTIPITLNNTNGWNNFSSTFTTGSLSWLCTYTDVAKRVYVDTQAPTAPSITALSITNLCPSTWLNITRSGSYDTWSLLSLLNYKYEVYNNSGMVTGMVLSWTTTGTSVNITLSLLPLGTYYMKISAVDIVGNISAYSNSINFTTSQQYCGGGSGVVIVTPTIRLRNINLNTVYRSDPIYILGLTGPTLVTISKWMLFLNNSTGGNWTTGMVTSADTLYIELISSDEYDTTVTSELHILGLTGTFSVTTKKNNCSLTAAEKLTIENIYADIKDQYNDNLSLYSDFLNTFQSMVQDESDLSNSCTLDYLLSLIEDDYGSEGVDTSNHITPNCKEYSIGYDTDQEAYYAPEMAIRYYFVNRESLIRHLDYYNPGDCHINTYGDNLRTANTSDPMKHTAPNGKIYHLIGQYGGFSATEFATAKYFDSLETITRYIDIRNPAKEIRTHTVDTMFIPVVYAAPNGKEYKIYKTDRWFMSYKLMKVKYYETLSDLKNYINRNNPSRR